MIMIKLKGKNASLQFLLMKLQSVIDQFYLICMCATYLASIFRFFFVRYYNLIFVTQYRTLALTNTVKQ